MKKTSEFIINPLLMTGIHSYMRWDGLIFSGTCVVENRRRYFDLCIDMNWYADSYVYNRIADSYVLYEIWDLPDSLLRKLLYLENIWYNATNPKQDYWTYKKEFMQNWFPNAKSYYEIRNYHKFGTLYNYGVMSRSLLHPHRMRSTYSLRNIKSPDRFRPYIKPVNVCNLDYANPVDNYDE